MTVRQAARAGMFYEASPDACRSHAARLFASATLPEDLPADCPGGLLPHAGWVYSGAVAALTIKALLAPRGEALPLGGDAAAPTVVLFGADHTGQASGGHLWADGAWDSPLGAVKVDTDLADELLAVHPLLQADPKPHRQEHSLEVQVPLLAWAAPQVRIVPIAMAPTRQAHDIGRAVGEALARGNHPGVFVIGSTDLTHHGGHFGSPGGSGAQSEAFATENDERMLEHIRAMQAEAIVPEARERGNACGPGAIAATIAACKALGASTGRVLEYTNSYRITHRDQPNNPDDTTVGYASVVFQ